jgi:hypothetical protein
LGQFAGRAFIGFPVNVNTGRLRTVPYQRLRNGAADALSTSGNKGDLTAQIDFHSFRHSCGLKRNYPFCLALA